MLWRRQDRRTPPEWVMFSAIPLMPEIGPFVAARISKGYSPDHLWRLAVELIVIFAGAAVGEALAIDCFDRCAGCCLAR